MEQVMIDSDSTDLPEPIEAYYTVIDHTQGSWWNRWYRLEIKFSADDFDEFSTKFQQMSDEIGQWHAQHKKKAKLLEIAVFAHPWILKRILQRFNAEFTTGHGYGDFCRQGTVKLHLFDALDPQGQHYLMAEQGKTPQETSK